jgi:hypothetical protein
VSDLDSLWESSVQYLCEFKAGVSSSYKAYQATYKGEKRKELMWIHHFVILQLFHPFVWKKTFVLSTKIVDYFFVNSILKRLKNILIFSMILQGMSGCGWVKTIDMLTGCGWVKTIDMFTGYELYHSVR